MASIPKVIYSLWLGGREKAPDVVRLNFNRWEKLNPGYDLTILDGTDVTRLLNGFPLAIHDLPPQALSDILRARLLVANGGIWVDASVFPVKPLDDWLSHILSNAGFFAFARPGPDRAISSWFLLSTSDNLILRAWWKEIERFWARPRRLSSVIPADPVASVSPHSAPEATYPYFWFHYLFQYTMETKAEVAALWSDCIKSPADLPHGLQTLFARDPSPSAAAIRQTAYTAPVQKLNWRASYPLDVLAAL